MSEFIVLVKRPYTSVDPVKVTVKTDSAFDGTGLLTRNQNIIDFSLTPGGAVLKFDGADNKFPGAKLTAGVDLFAVAKTPSGHMNDVVLTLTLSGGSKKIKPPANIKLTALQATLEICEPRLNDATPGAPLPTANAAPGANPTDKFYLGRPLPEQSKPKKIDERAMLIVRDVHPPDFTGNFELRLDNDEVELYATERAKDTDKPLTVPVPVPGRPGAKGFQVFVEGAKASPSARHTGVVLGVKDVKGEADHVRISVCHTEIVSNRKWTDLKIADRVPEKPERKTNSTFIVAPIIVGLEYAVELRAYIEKATASAFAWSTPSDKVNLKDVNKVVAGLTAKKLSAKLDDVPIELLLTTDLGKLKKRHLLTSVQVEMNPVSTGDFVRHTDAINKIRNPAGCVVLTGGDAADVNAVPRYEITKIKPNLTWTDDDERIAWWILGGDAKGDNKYDGKASFMNTEPAKRGTRIQVFGGTEGDILIQPYSGGYGYGMLRAHVVKIQKVKYRITRVFTTAQAAKPPVPLQAALPVQAAVPAYPGGGAFAAQPAVDAHDAVPALPAIPAVAKRDAHAPVASHADAKLHMKIVNIYLRQIGFEMIPDDSAEMANPKIAASAAVPEVKAQKAITAQPAIPPAGRPAVPQRPAVPERAAVAPVVASAGNPKVGDASLDSKVVKATRVEAGHFDVEVNDEQLTFNFKAGQKPAIQINARNEVISFAYIEADPTISNPSKNTLATALLCPANHTPKTRARQPEAWSAAAFTLDDLGTPTTSLTPTTGIPPNTPASKISMNVLFPDVAWLAGSPGTRDIRLLWGIIVPTRNIVKSVKPPKSTERILLAYGNTLAHELGHVFGMGHRGDLTDPVPDGLGFPTKINIMDPDEPPPRAENFDIIQVKAVRFSEVMFRTP